MAVLLASSAVAPEIESGRLHAVLARPLSRTSWPSQRAGTFAGLAAVYVVVMSLAVLAIASGVAGYGAIAPGRAVGLLALEVVVLVALGTALSVRLSAIAAGVVVIALYGAAWIARDHGDRRHRPRQRVARTDRRGGEPRHPLRRPVARRLLLPAVARPSWP